MIHLSLLSSIAFSIFFDSSPYLRSFPLPPRLFFAPPFLLSFLLPRLFLSLCTPSQSLDLFIQWQQGKLNGIGVFEQQNRRYEGEIQQDKPHGQGMCVYVCFSSSWPQRLTLASLSISLF